VNRRIELMRGSFMGGFFGSLCFCCRCEMRAVRLRLRLKCDAMKEFEI